ncbi:MAG: imelysin family protein, partial [Planctomycetota bacterium]
RRCHGREITAEKPKGRDVDYVCTLVQAVAQDIDANASAILAEWEGGYADLLGNPGNDTYRTEAEAVQQFFTSLSTGLEFTWGTRLARPMGTFDRPRPNRAEGGGTSRLCARKRRCRRKA